MAESKKLRSIYSLTSRIYNILAMFMLAYCNFALASPDINQLPEGEKVTSGTVNISRTDNNMVINQESHKAIIQWQSFDIGGNASVKINQPSTNSVILNKVISSNPSQIYGNINANGQVFLVNPSGIYFSPTSSVNVGGLVATTNSISDNDFISENYHFTRNGATGTIINEGKLESKLGGYIALLAPEVINQGIIITKLGTATLASGDSYTLQYNGDSLVDIEVSASTIKASVENKSAVIAEDGLIILSAKALDSVQSSIVNNSGVLEAKGIISKGGTIKLSAGVNGDVANKGKIDVASINDKGGIVKITGKDILIDNGSEIIADGKKGGGKILIGGSYQNKENIDQALKTVVKDDTTIKANALEKGDGGQIVIWSDITNSDSSTTVKGKIAAEGGIYAGDGGLIETSGYNLDYSGSNVSAKSFFGQSGDWLLDPYDLTVDSSAANSIVASLNSGTNVTLQANTNSTSGYGNSNSNGSGNIIINSAINGWTNTAHAAKLTMSAYSSIIFNTILSVPNNVNSSVSLNYNQFGGSGGNLKFSPGAKINFANTSSSLSINNNSYILTSSLDNVGSSGNYAISSDITESTTRIDAPISSFYGNFEGLGHTISNLRISSSDGTPTAMIGIFGSSSSNSMIENINLVNPIISSSNNDASVIIGSLFANGSGGSGGGDVVYGCSASGGSLIDNTISDNGGVTGGLIGQFGGTIKSSFTDSLTIVGNNTIGGLLGYMDGSTAQILNAYSTNSTISGASMLGGLVGYIDQGSLIENTYSNNNITATEYSVGGLIGWNNSNAQVINSYSSGKVFGGVGNIGGLIGSDYGTITSSYWDTLTSGQSSSSSGTGYTTSQLQDVTNYTNIYSGWDFTNVWAPPNTAGTGGSSSYYPQLYANANAVTALATQAPTGGDIMITYTGLLPGDTVTTTPTFTGTGTVYGSGGNVTSSVSGRIYRFIYLPSTIYQNSVTNSGNSTINTESSNAADQVAVFVNNSYNNTGDLLSNLNNVSSDNTGNIISNSTSVSSYVPSKALISSSPAFNAAPSSEPDSKVSAISTSPDILAASKTTAITQNVELSIPAGNVSIAIPDQVKSIISTSSNSSSSASLKLTQEDGSELPSWISINSETGSVTLNNAPTTFSLNVIINSNNQRISLKLSR